MDALLFLSRHLWGGASGVRQEMQQSRPQPWRTAVSWKSAAFEDLPDQRPLSRYADTRQAGRKGHRHDNRQV